ncbi:MAG: hypothetical protein CME02_03875 [Geminicoccus sp.]|nr:hypothetical protein [Geminicoccus sp.]
MIFFNYLVVIKFCFKFVFGLIADITMLLNELTYCFFVITLYVFVLFERAIDNTILNHKNTIYWSFDEHLK